MNPSDSAKPPPPHFTVRRGFIAAAGFGLTSLYLVWAGYGAAPLGLHAGGEEGAGHGDGHGGSEGAGASAAIGQFKRDTEEFVERHRLADGSVRPRPVALHGHDAHGAHGDAPVDVYLMAYQWGFTPAVLRLEAGVPYRFRMMAVDVAHGASLQLGRGSRIVRLRPGTLMEQEYRFTRPGEHFIYCTVYCGLPHDRMQARLIVAPAGAGS